MTEDTNDLSQPIEEKYLPVKTNSTITPVTIRQILKARESENQINTKIIDNVEIKDVSVVGMVRESTRNSFSTMYVIDDGTGYYLVQVVHPDNNSPSESETFEEGQYISVTGRLSTTSQEDQNEPISVISAYSIRLCTDSNQIPYHFLHSLYVHLATLKNYEDRIGQSSQKSITDYLEFNDRKPKKITNEYENDSGNEKIDSSPVNLNEIQIKMTTQKKLEIVKRSVLRLLGNTTADNGYDIQKIFNNLSNVFAIDDIQSAVDSLSYNGEIASTGLDENYFIV